MGREGCPISTVFTDRSLFIGNVGTNDCVVQSFYSSEMLVPVLNVDIIN